MKSVYDAHYCSLHVRVTNRAAITLYKDVLGYETMKVEEKYYADGEDAFDMCFFFNEKTRQKKKAENGHADAEEETKSTQADSVKLESTPISKDSAKKGGDSETAKGEDGGAGAAKKKKKKNKKKKDKADTGEEKKE